MLNIQNMLYENKRKNIKQIEKPIKMTGTNNGFYVNKDNNDSIEDLGNLMQPKTQGKLLLFNRNKELLVTQRSENDPEYPMHYSLIDFIMDKDNNNISVLLDKATTRRRVKITYCHHNNPQDIVEEKLYIVEFENDILYSDKKMEKVFWADKNKLDELRDDINYVLTPLFKRILQNYQPLYESLEKIKKQIDFGDLNYYDANQETNFMLYKPYSYTRSCPGKSIRGKLLDLCCSWIPIERKILHKIKEIIETIHCCTLMIDDIEDGSQLRRKCKCSHILFGESLTINAAYMRIFKLLNDLKSDKKISESQSKGIHDNIIGTLLKLHEGQGGDLYWSNKKYCPSVSQYLKMIENKTGALFNLIPNLCFLFVENNSKQDKITLFFHLLSKFYQIRDDYINLTSFHYWQEKGLCSDIEEGKFTYPIILTMADLSSCDEIYEIMTSNERYDQKIKLRALDIMQRCGSLAKTRNYLDDLRKEIIETASMIDYNEYIEDIMSLLDY